MGHARVLSKLENSNQQQELVNKVLNEGISVRELEDLTKAPTIVKANPQHHRENNYSEYNYLQNELSDKLGTKVLIKKNKIEISFVNGNDLNRILEILNIEVER